MNKINNQGGHGSLRQKLYIIIFEADTPAGKLFDVTLIICIILSVLAVMLDSVSHINEAYIAVPTGIVTAEFMLVKDRFPHKVCLECSAEDHAHAAKFCKDCGEKL